MENNINLINQKMTLIKVVFEKKNNQVGQFQVNTQDSIDNLSINEDGISFNYSRHVSLIPEALFDIEVMFNYSARFDQKSIDILREKDFKLENKAIKTIISNTIMPQTASMIISNLTVINGGNPLVTQPSVAISHQ